MKRTAEELTATIADFWNDYDPYSGLTFSETIENVITMYNDFRNGNIDAIKADIESLTDVIEALDAEDADEKRIIDTAQEIIDDINDTYNIGTVPNGIKITALTAHLYEILRNNTDIMEHEYTAEQAKAINDMMYASCMNNSDELGQVGWFSYLWLSRKKVDFKHIW